MDCTQLKVANPTTQTQEALTKLNKELESLPKKLIFVYGQIRNNDSFNGIAIPFESCCSRDNSFDNSQNSLTAIHKKYRDMSSDGEADKKGFNESGTYRLTFDQLKSLQDFVEKRELIEEQKH